MPTSDEALQTALAHHQAGRLPEAELLYRQILAAEPSNARAWHFLGMLAYQAGQLEVAVQHIGRSLELQPDDPQAFNNLGMAHHAQKRLEEAMAFYRRALNLKSDFIEAHNNLGNALQEQRRVEEAIACYRRALQLQPNFAEAHHNLGNAFKALSDPENAKAAYRRALELNPHYVEAYNNLGNVLREQGATNEAAACYCRALELQPDEPATLYNLGLTVQDQGKFPEAITYYRRAIELKPTLVEAQHNLGGVFLKQGKYGDAAACFERAVELQPELAEAQFNLSTLKLLAGDFEHGWPQYEWRWKVGQADLPKFQQPQWAGQPLNGQKILLHAEQGLGDTIQFIRYMPLVKDLGATVLVACPRPMFKLLATCSGIDGLFGNGDEVPPFDVHAPLMSLPGIFKTTLRNIPNSVPYLHADPELVERWRDRLNAARGFRIGINWHGREGLGHYRQRDIPLDCFASLANLPDVQLISLQKGDGQDGMARSGLPIIDLGPDVDTAHGAFMDTAAIMMNLDLVITSDTSIPHLAGALGVPVWLALPFVPNWRWLLNRADSPWYPTMRLFRQKQAGDWRGVFDEMHAALYALVTPQ
jgi:tetratricopeptide (TPR) repeat protein